MGHKSEVFVEADVIINEGKNNESYVQVTFNRKTEWGHDAHYGADADGNRGMPMTFIEEDFAEDIKILNVGRYTEKEYVAIDTLLTHVREQIQKGIDNWLERNPPEYIEYEPDCDVGD